ncbi:MAG: RNA-binding protein [Rhodospirillales bacterium]|nr:RNA-binding protein [Rhodospirillales bacterium]
MARGREVAPGRKKRRARDNKAEVPVRKCIVTGAERAKTDLIRFVVGPDGNVVPDLEAKLPGRALWLSAVRDVVNTACAKGLFAKAARSKADAPADLADQLEGLLVERCIGLLGMARRSGSVVSGYEKVRAYLQDDKAGLLLAAREGALGGRRKVRNLAPELKEWDRLSGKELAQALGREAVIHVAVARGPLADRLATECRRLGGFRQPLEQADEV